MASKEFDPYGQRLARDTRNALAHAFVHDLQAGAARAGLPAAQRLLSGGRLPASHQRWVRDRLERYGQAQRALGDVSGRAPLALGLDLWRLGLFFEAHEALEQAWQSASGERRLALKALVQAVGSCVHARRGADAPAQSLARKAGATLLAQGRALPELPWLPRLAQRLARGQPGFLDEDMRP